MFAPTNQTDVLKLKPLLSRLAMFGAAAFLVFSIVTSLSALGLLADSDESLKMNAQAAHLFGSCVAATALFSVTNNFFYQAGLPPPELPSMLPAIFGSLFSAYLLGHFSSYVDQNGLMLTLNGLESTKVDLLANTIATGLILSAIEWFERRGAPDDGRGCQAASLSAFLWMKYGTPRLRQPRRGSN